MNHKHWLYIFKKPYEINHFQIHQDRVYLLSLSYKLKRFYALASQIEYTFTIFLSWMALEKIFQLISLVEALIDLQNKSKETNCLTIFPLI